MSGRLAAEIMQSSIRLILLQMETTVTMSASDLPTRDNVPDHYKWNARQCVRHARCVGGGIQTGD